MVFVTKRRHVRCTCGSSPVIRSFLRSSTCKDSRIERRWGTVPAGDRVYLSGTHIGMGRGPTVASRNAASTPLMERGSTYS